LRTAKLHHSNVIGERSELLSQADVDVIYLVHFTALTDLPADLVPSSLLLGLYLDFFLPTQPAPPYHKPTSDFQPDYTSNFPSHSAINITMPAKVRGMSDHTSATKLEAFHDSAFLSSTLTA